jgi:deoxyadenosine/deoxycytidine kinase
MGKKVVTGNNGKPKRVRRRGNGVEEADGTSEDAYADIYNKYDQLAQDFRKCNIMGAKLKEDAPSQVCVEERE